MRRLVADGLLDQNSSVCLHWPGQPLSLTPQGETALRESRTATPRVSAALSRSSTAPNPRPAADPPATPGAGAARSPSV